MNMQSPARIEKWMSYVFMSMFLLLLVFSTMPLVISTPTGPVITFNQTQNITLAPATTLTTVGGSFTIISLNATTQTPRWKAYAGNVTGVLTLADANNKSIYDWRLSSVTGEVYATRNNSISWSTIVCANTTAIATEESSLSIASTNADSINATFATNIHRSFYVGLTAITNSTCPAIRTYVNGVAQVAAENASFQEMLLMDSSNRVVYTTLINQNTTGFNNQKYDFQLIVAENEFQANPSTYYLYVELI